MCQTPAGRGARPAASIDLAIQASSPRFGPWRVFAVSTALVAIASLIFILWTTQRIGGDQVSIAVDDIGEAVAAGIAALSCGIASWRAAGRLRLAWGLLAASAASWCAGEIVWSVYEVGLGVEVPYPSAADIGFVGAIPLAVAGILAFSHTPRGTSVGLRLWLDRAIVFLALLFVAWELGLNIVFNDAEDSLLERLIDLSYPIGDIAIGTVLVLAIRRATDEQQGRLFLLLGGLAANAVADSAFAYLTATGAYGAIGSVLDAGWVIGYLMIALAALWPSGMRDKTGEEKPIDIWQLALPWLAILAAGLTALVQAARGHPLDTFGTVAAGVLALLLMVSQVLAHNESLTLLIRSRLSAATLNEVIVNAPLGVVRIATDLTILQANPSFASILQLTTDELIGGPLSRFFSANEMELISQRLTVLSSGAAIEFDTQASRADGTTIWLHWTATVVVNRAGHVDYFLVMFEDVSARRAAEEVAAANLEVLERLNKVKSQFLTTVSHEFRTALVGIQGFSEFIRDAETLEVDEVKEFANDIYDDAQRLNQTLTDMLELDRSQVGGGGLHLAEVDLTALIHEAVASVQLGTADHAITADLQELPVVNADREMLSQVVTSLLGRAVDYSPPAAAILVSARADNGDVQVSVTDHGRAVASDLEAQLLGHGGSSVSHAQIRVLATNVGLPMARQIVEMHGGRIWYEVGAGTVWNFTIPVAARTATLQFDAGRRVLSP
jgi:two-component system sensor histidine kinase/response regulator